VSTLPRLAKLRCARALAALAVATSAAGARATEGGPQDGERVQLSVTEATSAFYNVDNRNTRPGDVTRRLDDDWAVWYNRLNAQASYGHFQVGLRLDSAVFQTRVTPTSLALDLLREKHGGTLPATYDADDASFFVQKTEETSRELATRFTSWLYPAKYYAGYADRDVEATLGDFYAQLGRGFVLSVRKQDELASDTTIRGARATYRIKEGAFRVRVTGMGGTMNPLRIDEASGRYLGVTSSVTSGLAALTEAGMPRATASPFDDHAEPTYAPDRVVAGQIEGGTREIQIGIQGSLLDRALVSRAGTDQALTPGVVRSADAIRTASTSVSVPDLWGHGNLYVEAAMQSLSYPESLARSGAELPDTGYAVYGALGVEERPVTITAEAKHYRRFFPLAANVDLAHAPEFAPLQYSAPPTTEAFWVDTELGGFNTCVSGGRLKADLALTSTVTASVSASRYVTWAESVANDQCRTTDTNANRIWDFASGLEARSRNGKSRGTLTTGTRFDDTDRAIQDAGGGETHVFYRELYARYDVIAWLGGPYSLKLQGWDRRRRETVGGIEGPWTELSQLVAIDYAPRLTVGGSFEYTGNPQFAPTYFAGMLGYNFSSSSNVSLFAGQRRGGLRCVSGVCRIYPPFEGVRIDATFRF
jgi:hypothetical protein